MEYQEVKLRLPRPLMLGGVEYEPTGEWRCVEPGEVYLAPSGTPYQANHRTFSYIILRPKWKWPKWLVLRFIAKEPSGRHVAFQSRPTWTGNYWMNQSGPYAALGAPGERYDFTPIPGPASESLRENPNWKEPNDA